jgi:hypothetical protein
MIGGKQGRECSTVSKEVEKRKETNMCYANCTNESIPVAETAKVRVYNG